MINVVFVGDKHSRKNVHMNIPFVGAGCFKRLVSWIKTINPDYYVCYNSYKIQDLSEISTLFKNGFKVIALGEKASKELTIQQIDHMKLPHPSGLNRKLNDDNYIKQHLDNAYKFVRG